MLRLPGLVPATVVALILGIGGFWGYEAGVIDVRTARLVKTRARMHDGMCVFTAAFHLKSPTDQATFALHQNEIRGEIVDAMRVKSRYMVQSPSAQKGLAVQFSNVVNRVTGRRIAANVTFDEFELSDSTK